VSDTRTKISSLFNKPKLSLNYVTAASTVDKTRQLEATISNMQYCFKWGWKDTKCSGDMI